MKPQKTRIRNRKNREFAIAAYPAEAALYEFLALHRLRWAKRWALLRRMRQKALRASLSAAKEAAIALFEPAELVQQVGPGRRPLRRHEWTPPNPEHIHGQGMR